MADALDSGSSGSFILWEFKSPLPHWWNVREILGSRISLIFLIIVISCSFILSLKTDHCVRIHFIKVSYIFPFCTFEIIIILYVLYFMLPFFNIFVIICLGFMPGCYLTLTWMAVRFARRVKLSSDYIDHLFWEILERRISLCWPLLTWSQWSHCVWLFIVLVTCVESMIPRRKNNRPSS